MPDTVSINGSVEVIQVSTTEYVIEVNSSPVEVITVGAQGPQGPEGPPGTGSVVNVINTTTDYTVSQNSDLVLADSTAGMLTITLPNPTKGWQVIVKKIDTSDNYVNVVSSFGVDLIDGFAELTRRGLAMTFTADGSRWYITAVVSVT